MKITVFKRLILFAVPLQAMQFAYSQTMPADVYSHAKNLPHHCKVDEQIVLTCTFKHKKTMSLCAQSQPDGGVKRLQYRYGFLSKKHELIYPIYDDKKYPSSISEHPANSFDWKVDSRFDINKHATANFANEWHKTKKWTTQKLKLGEITFRQIYFYPIETNKHIEFQINVTTANPFSKDEGVDLSISKLDTGLREVKGIVRGIAAYTCLPNSTFENLSVLN